MYGTYHIRLRLFRHSPTAATNCWFLQLGAVKAVLLACWKVPKQRPFFPPCLPYYLRDRPEGNSRKCTLLRISNENTSAQSLETLQNSAQHKITNNRWLVGYTCVVWFCYIHTFWKYPRPRVSFLRWLKGEQVQLAWPHHCHVASSLAIRRLIHHLVVRFSHWHWIAFWRLRHLRGIRIISIFIYFLFKCACWTGVFRKKPRTYKLLLNEREGRCESCSFEMHG